jgi:hypothetical protein
MRALRKKQASHTTPSQRLSLFANLTRKGKTSLENSWSWLSIAALLSRLSVPMEPHAEDNGKTRCCAWSLVLLKRQSTLERLATLTVPWPANSIQGLRSSGISGAHRRGGPELLLSFFSESKSPGRLLGPPLYAIVIETRTSSRMDALSAPAGLLARNTICHSIVNSK